MLNWKKVYLVLDWIGLVLFVFGLWHLLLVGIIDGTTFGPLITEAPTEMAAEIKLTQYWYYRMDYTYVPLFIGLLLLISRRSTER